MSFPELKSRVALVTGAARRRSIGRATALRLAREGCDVACLDIARPYTDFPEYGLGSADELEDLVREISALGCRALALRADVSSWDEVHRAVAEAHEKLGRIDICCNVAGGSGFGMGSAPLLQLTEREWDRVLDVNLKGTWIVSRACAERMADSGRGGRIVNVSSQAGKRAFPTMGAYCAAKAGVILLTQVMAMELAPFGITVNAVCPGTVDTDLLQKNLAFEHAAAGMGMDPQQWIAREIPLGRLESADDVASAIAFLTSDDAADIMAALFFHWLRLDDTRRPRDHFILSKGHAVHVLHACLVERGLLDAAELQTCGMPGSRLAGHPTRRAPGVEFATGSLGHGLSVGMGMALGEQLRGSGARTVVLMGDGELQEGTVWETALAAPRFGLENLLAIVDYNRLQACGAVDDIVPLEPLVDKWRAFRWNVHEIDGHDLGAIVAALDAVPAERGPTVIIAHTIKGKGVPGIEGTTAAHYAVLADDDVARARTALGVDS